MDFQNCRNQQIWWKIWRSYKFHQFSNPKCLGKNYHRFDRWKFWELNCIRQVVNMVTRVLPIKWGLKEVFQAGMILWDAIIYPCLRYLLLAPKSFNYPCNETHTSLKPRVAMMPTLSSLVALEVVMNDNLQCHQWWQSCPNNDSVVSVTACPKNTAQGVHFVVVRLQPYFFPKSF